MFPGQIRNDQFVIIKKKILNQIKTATNEKSLTKIRFNLICPEPEQNFLDFVQKENLF